MAAEQNKMELAIEFNRTAASLEASAQKECMSVLGQLIGADSEIRSEAWTLRTRDKEKVIREERQLEVEKVERDHPNGLYQQCRYNHGTCTGQAYTSKYILGRIANGELPENSKSTLCKSHKDIVDVRTERTE